MSRPDFLSADHLVRLPQTLRDGETAPVQSIVPHTALALLPALHREAGRDLHLWHLLAASPQFCIALMLEGAVAIGTGGGALDAAFVWTAAMLVGIAAVTGNHIRGFAQTPRQKPLTETARELRLLLLYLGIAWGFGAFLIVPQKPALVFAFAAVPSLITALIFEDEKAVFAFGAPAILVTASALLWGRPDWTGQAWAGAILLAGMSIAALSMLQCANLRHRRLQALH